MPEFHRLDPRADARFLEAGARDPLTNVAFRPANEVVRCATCGVVALRETWEALDGCPNGHDTPAPWPTAAAGDGAATAAPIAAAGAPTAVPTAAPAPAGEATGAPRWLTPVLVAVGVAGLLVLGVLVAGLLTDDDVPDAPPPVTTPAGPTGPTPVAVAEPGLIEGALTEGDFVGEDGRYQDLYTFAADSSGRALTFRASSETLYPRLVVETPSGERLVAELVDEDPDSGRRTVAVAEALREPGLYRVRVTSREPGETGPYSVRIESELPVRPIVANGRTLQNRLGEFSERVDGVFRDRYRFTAEGEREYTVTVNSAAFAPAVRVEGPDGAAVRGETGRASGTVTFVFTAARSGPHTILVASREAEARGDYRIGLEMEEEQAEPALRALPTDGSPVADSLAAGQTRTFALAGRVGDRVQIEVRADGFEPSLTLLGPDGARAGAAAPDGDRARLRDVVLPTQGTYRLVVGAPGGGGGTFRVTVEQAAVVAPEDIPRTPGQFGP